MGGNVKVGQHKAVPIDLGVSINDTRMDILDVMYNISRQLQSMPFGDAHINMSCFTGSTDIVMNGHISNEELVKYKPHLGDVDMQMKYSCKYAFEDLLKKKPQFGNYQVLGVSKHGNEFSVLCHNTVFGEVHQFDFQFVDEPGNDNERFLHSASWEDIKLGIKGAHHKILLNAVGLEEYKFSIINGLIRRDPLTNFTMGTRTPRQIQRTLFGDMSLYTSEKIDSFVGVLDLMAKFTWPQKILPIFEKFAKDAGDRVKDSEANHNAIMYFGDKFGVYSYA